MRLQAGHLLQVLHASTLVSSGCVSNNPQFGKHADVWQFRQTYVSRIDDIDHYH